jgi:hypothetical protein
MNNWPIKIVPYVSMSKTDWFEPYFLKDGYVPSRGDYIMINNKKYAIVSVTIYPEIVQLEADTSLRRML